MIKKKVARNKATTQIAKSTVAKRAAADFLGRVVRSPLESLTVPLGVRRPHQVWFPKSKADVATAVALSRGLPTFVRSGTQAAAGDTVDGAGGIVISLTELKHIDVKKGVVNVEAAATVGTISEHLTKHGLVLPLGDNPALSLASNVLHEVPSCLMRTLGPLSDYVTRISAMTSDAQPVIRAGASAVARAVAEKAVLTGVAFKPATAKNLWMFRKSFLYPGNDQFLGLARALFLNTRIPARSDVVLDAFPGRHNVPMVRITAVGASNKDAPAVKTFVENALAGLPADFKREIISETYSAQEVIQAIVHAGFEVPADPAVQAERFDQVVEQNADLGDFLSRVTEDVNRALAFRPDGTGEVDADLRMITRLQLDRNNRVRLSGFVLSPSSAVPTAPPLLAAVTPLARTDLLHPAFDLFPPLPSRIPGFQGEVFIPSDSSYADRAKQYATSSHPAPEMTPFMVTYPRDENDIKAAIEFAKWNGKKIVARSGGHQYSGKSSGDAGTIVLAMDAFDHFRDISSNVVEVGPAVMLTCLAAKFRSRGITIPHGECPRVSIGGHAQSGGFGHLLRGFGLALDHVAAIRIVLADGTVSTLNRPNGAPATPPEELFWGVLGGNAGSFGIVTSYRFECIKDSDHSNSYGFAAIRRYEKSLYRNLMKQVQGWTQGVADGTLDPDVDFMMTVESSSAPFPPPLLLVELVHSDLGGPTDPNFGHPRFQPIIEASDAGAGPWQFLTTRGRKPLSFWSDKFVRRPPETTSDGREFKYPYKKRINCTVKELSDPFVDQFVGMVDEVVEQTDGVYLVFQMLIGGGSYRSSPRRPETSIPQRDYVFCFGFDLFYKDGFDQTAVALQQRMQALIDAHFSADQERRLFWGSFGDTDMTNPATRDAYYDNPVDYAKLQRLKQRVDPGDLFHTSFTVKL